MAKPNFHFQGVNQHFPIFSHIFPFDQAIWVFVLSHTPQHHRIIDQWISPSPKGPQGFAELLSSAQWAAELLAALPGPENPQDAQSKEEFYNGVQLQLAAASCIFHHFSSFFIVFHHFSSFFIIFHHLFIILHHFSYFFIIFHHFSSFSQCFTFFNDSAFSCFLHLHRGFIEAFLFDLPYLRMCRHLFLVQSHSILVLVLFY